MDPHQRHIHGRQTSSDSSTVGAVRRRHRSLLAPLGYAGDRATLFADLRHAPPASPNIFTASILCVCAHAAPVVVLQNSLQCGAQHTCALNQQGRAFCWGLGNYGQLGNIGQNSSSVPIPVDGRDTWRTISAGVPAFFGGNRTEGGRGCSAAVHLTVQSAVQ